MVHELASRKDPKDALAENRCQLKKDWETDLTLAAVTGWGLSIDERFVCECRMRRHPSAINSRLRQAKGNRLDCCEPFLLPCVRKGSNQDQLLSHEDFESVDDDALRGRHPNRHRTESLRRQNQLRRVHRNRRGMPVVPIFE